MSISVRYIYSACIVVKTPDVTVLCDPWFTQGIYDGAWYHFPEVRDPVASIGDVDKIYISHIHPDHYDAGFLRSYFARYGAKELLIADHQPNHLFFKMKADGFDAVIVKKPLTIGQTNIDILPHKTGSQSDIDSALFVKYDDGKRIHSVANANDIIFDDEMITKFKDHAGDVDILCCGFTGAGPFPQTYFDLDDPELDKRAAHKKQQFFERYKKLVDAVGAKRNIPFAGKYMLGGKLTPLNAHRGVSDPVDVLAVDDHAVVLADNGGEIDTGTFKPTAVRTELYYPGAIKERMAELQGKTMAYERLVSMDEVHQLPIKRLLSLAAKRAFARSECAEDYHFVIPVPGGEVAVLNINNGDPSLRYQPEGDALPEPYSRIDIDPRYLFGLLTNVYHWNNAEVGSQYNVRRRPNELKRSAQSFLNYLAIG